MLGPGGAGAEGSATLTGVANSFRDWHLYPVLLLGMVTWPLWGIADMVRDWRFHRRFGSAKDLRAFDGEHLLGNDGSVALDEVVGARGWSNSMITMASGAEESLGLELRLRDGTVRRYAGYGYALSEAYAALAAAGKVPRDLENGGNSGGIGRVLMLGFWMCVLGGAALYAINRVG